MRSLSALTLILLAALVATAGGQSRKSKEVELKTRTFVEGRFKVALPGDTAERVTKQVQTDAGVLTVTTDSKAVNRDFTLSVTWTDYPETFKAVSPAKLLESVAAGMKTKDAKLVVNKDLPAADPNPAGREVQYEYGKNHVRARLYLVGTRLYQVTATGKKDDVEGELARKFLASFELTD